MIVIDKKSKVTIIQQIVQELEERIRSGLLKTNTKLPSIRSLSKEIGVSPMTVVTAYENLEHKGLIIKIHGKGSFVADFERTWLTHSELSEDKQIPTSNPDWHDEIQDYVTRSGYVQRVMMTRELGIKNMAIAALHHRFLPTQAIFDSFSGSLKGDYSVLSKYPPIEGDSALIEEMIEYLKTKDVGASHDEIFVTSGSQAAIHLVAETFIGHGDVVVVESPTFPGAIDVFKNRGAIVLEVPMGQQGLRADKLLTICEKYPVKLVYTMSSYQNPTGITMELPIMQELLVLAKEHGFIILEDDSWSDIYFGKLERPIKGLDTNGHVIHVAGMSKVLGPSFRLSIVVCNRIFKEKLIAAKSNIDSGSPLLNQSMLVPYLNSLKHLQHLTWVRHKLKDLKERSYAKLKEVLPSNVKVSSPNGGLVFWLTFPYSFDCKQLYYYLLQEKRITFLLGENCYSSIRGKNQMRLCYSYLEEDVMMKCIEDIGEAVQRILKNI